MYYIFGCLGPSLNHRDGERFIDAATDTSMVLGTVTQHKLPALSAPSVP